MTEEKMQCECDSNMMFYFRVWEDETTDPCAILHARNKIGAALEFFGFYWVDATGGQAAFDTHRKDFEKFKGIVRLVEKMEHLNVIELRHCPYPGTGLFD
jgi:hypothetical protein